MTIIDVLKDMQVKSTKEIKIIEKEIIKPEVSNIIYVDFKSKKKLT